MNIVCVLIKFYCKTQISKRCLYFNITNIINLCLLFVFCKLIKFAISKQKMPTFKEIRHSDFLHSNLALPYKCKESKTNGGKTSFPKKMAGKFYFIKSTSINGGKSLVP